MGDIAGDKRVGLAGHGEAAMGHSACQARVAVLPTAVWGAAVVRADHAAVPPGAASEVHAARAVAEQALRFSRRARFTQPALVNGTVGVVVAPRGRLFEVMLFSVTRGKIAEIDVLADPVHLRQLELAVLSG